MATKRQKKDAPQEPQRPTYPMVVETFREVGPWELGNMRQQCPSCFNGIVSVRRYRVTVEQMDEPVEVIRERIQTLWDRCDNHHHYAPLKAAAEAVGLTLSGRPGRPDDPPR